tara:strand:- start:27 stop:272 length:246 start_codon:yes stop_codon:yes gene_type:complete
MSYNKFNNKDLVPHLVAIYDRLKEMDNVAEKLCQSGNDDDFDRFSADYGDTEVSMCLIHDIAIGLNVEQEYLDYDAKREGN